MKKFIIVSFLTFYLLFFNILSIVNASSLNLPLALVNKPIACSDYLLLPLANNEIAIVDKDFKLIKKYSLPEFYFFHISNNCINIYSIDRFGNYGISNVCLFEIYHSILKNISELAGKKNILFIDKNLILVGSKIFNLTNDLVIDFPFDKFKFVKSDGNLIFVVDIFDKLNILNLKGELIGKYNLGRNISDIAFFDDSIILASEKGFYIINKLNFIVKKKYDFPGVPLKFYSYYPYVIFFTSKKLYIYDYINDRFIAIPFSDEPGDYYIYDEFYDGYYFYIDRHISQSEQRLIDVDITILENKMYAFIYRRKEFNGFVYILRAYKDHVSFTDVENRE